MYSSIVYRYSPYIPHGRQSVVRSCLLHDKPLKMATRCCSQNTTSYVLMSMSIVISAINIWFLCAVPCVVVPAIGARSRPRPRSYSVPSWGMCQNEVRCWLAQFIIYPGIATLRLIDMTGLAQSHTQTLVHPLETHTHTHTRSIWGLWHDSFALDLFVQIERAFVCVLVFVLALILVITEIRFAAK